MKKLNIKGFSHVEMILSVVVFVAIGSIGYFSYNRVKSNNSNSAGAGSYVGKIKHYQDIIGGGVTKINGVSYMTLSPRGVDYAKERQSQYMPRNMNIKACAHFRNIDSWSHIYITEGYTGKRSYMEFSKKTTYNICTPYFYTGSKGRNARIIVNTLSGKIGVDTMYYKR